MRRITVTKPDVKRDPFPFPAHGSVGDLDFPIHYRCTKCRRTIDVDDAGCKACGAVGEPGDKRTREWDNHCNVSHALTENVLDLAVLLLAANACECDCRRRRVLTRMILEATDELRNKVLVESRIGPAASDDQQLTDAEESALYEVRLRAPAVFSLWYLGSNPKAREEMPETMLAAIEQATRRA